MNAAEREVRANGRDDQSAQAEPSPTRRSHRSLEGRLIERILSLAGNPPILTQVWLTTKRELGNDPIGFIWFRPKDYTDRCLRVAPTLPSGSPRPGGSLRLLEC